MDQSGDYNYFAIYINLFDLFILYFIFENIKIVPKKKSVSIKKLHVPLNVLC